MSVQGVRGTQSTATSVLSQSREVHFSHALSSPAQIHRPECFAVAIPPAQWNLSTKVSVYLLVTKYPNQIVPLK